MSDIKLFIATPSHDSNVHAAYNFSIVHLFGRAPCKFVVPTAIYDGDLVRVRSRYVADFLESDATHLLFADSDMEFSPFLVDGLIKAGKDFVAAPYRKKRADMSWPFRLIEGAPTAIDQDTHTVRIKETGLGLALMTRSMLETMVGHYRQTLEFTDGETGVASREIVALFNLILAERGPQGRPLLSEDYSFCKRWSDIGGEVFLYLGPGAPAAHHGSFRFAANLTDLGKPAA
jgi:hypothetical protein